MSEQLNDLIQDTKILTVNKEEQIEPPKDSIKRKKSIKNLLSKKDNSNFDQLTLQVKHLKDQLSEFQSLNQELKEQIKEKDQEIFVDQSNNVVLTNKSYNDLVNRTVEHVSKDDLCSFVANKYNLKIMSSTEYQILNKPVDELYLKTEASQLGFKLLERQEYDFMKTKMETPDEQTLKLTAGKMGLELVSLKELEHLKNPTRAEIEKKLKKLGLVTVSETTRNSVIENSPVNLPSPTANNNESSRNSGFYNLRNSSKTSLNSSRVLASRDFFEQVIKDENSNKDVVLEAGRSLGFVRLSQEQYKKLLDGQKDKILTKTDIYSGAKDYQLTVLPNEEYRQLLKNRKNRQSMTFDDLNEYASKFKLKLIPSNVSNTETYEPVSPEKKSKEINERNSRLFLPMDSAVSNKNLDMSSNGNDKNTSLQTNAIFNLESIQNWCKKNDFRLSTLSIDEEVKKYAADLNLKVVPDEKFEELVKCSNGSISLEKVKEYVQNNNLKLLPQQQYDNIKALKDGKTIKDYSKEEIKNHLKVIDSEIYITTKDIILDLKKQIQSLEEKDITIEEIKNKFPNTNILSFEELSAIIESSKNDFTFEDIEAKYPDYTIVEIKELEKLTLQLNSALDENDKKLEFDNIQKEIDTNHLGHMIVLKKDFDLLHNQISDLVIQSANFQNQQKSLPTTVEQIEKELEIINPEFIVVNKEEMFKALNDNSVTYDELMDILESQYSDLVLLSKEEYYNLKEHSLIDRNMSIKELESVITKSYPDTTIVNKQEYETILKEKTNSTNSIEDVANLIYLKYPNNIVVDKSTYESQLQDLASEIKHNRDLIESLNELQIENENLNATFDDLSLINNILYERHPGSKVVKTSNYEKLLEQSKLAPQTINEFNHLISLNHSDLIIVKKEEYESHLKDLTTTLQSEAKLSEKLSLLGTETTDLQFEIRDLKEYSNKLKLENDNFDLEVAALKNDLEMIEYEKIALVSKYDSLNEKLKLENLIIEDKKAAISKDLQVELDVTNSSEHVKQDVEQKQPDKLAINKDDSQKQTSGLQNLIVSDINKLENLVQLSFPNKTIVDKAMLESKFKSLDIGKDKSQYSSEVEENDKQHYSVEMIADKEHNTNNSKVLSSNSKKIQTNTSIFSTNAPSEIKLTVTANTDQDDIEYDFSSAFIKSKAQEMGFNIISRDELNDLTHDLTFKGKEMIELNDLKQLASDKFDSKILTNVEYDELINKKDVDIDLLNQTAEDFGLALISNEQLENLNQQVKKLTTENLQQEQYISNVADVTLETLGETATEYGLAIVSQEKLEEYQNFDVFKEAEKLGYKIISNEEDQSYDIVSEAEKMGYRLISFEEYARFVEQKQIDISECNFKTVKEQTNDVIDNANNETGCPSLVSDSSLKANNVRKAEESGCRSISVKEHEDLIKSKEASQLNNTVSVPELEKSFDIFVEANKLGYKVISYKDFNEMIQEKELYAEINATEVEHQIDYNDKESLFTFEQGNENSTDHKVFQEKFSVLATKNNMTLVPTSTYKEMQQLPELTKELLVQRARDFDMIAIDLQQFTEITKANMMQKQSLQDLLIQIEDNGYVPLTQKEYEILKHPTKDDIANLAYNEWNMVLVERNNSIVGKNSNFGVNTSRNISGHSRQNSLIQIQPGTPRDLSYSGTTAAGKSLESSSGAYLFQPFQVSRNRSLNNSNKHFNLVEEAKKQNMLLIPETLYLNDLHEIPPVSADSKHNTLLLVERDQLETLLNTRHERVNFNSEIEIPNSKQYINQSAQDIHSINSTQTSAGFSNDKIIVSLTQTVIGEYLHKYYSKFGVFSKQRHERYFWIHPFTMTLYWSVTNPSKDSNKNVLDNKTKGVSIVGVEVLDDPNPYPPGLYNKSIIILTKDGKNVKITCPTQQRHKVWLRSLKYLQNAANSNDSTIGNGINRSRNSSRVATSTSYNRTSNESVNNSYNQGAPSYNKAHKMSPEVEQHPRFFVNSLK
ncbi:hypothetical protein QEN19_001876 [Hanseniaspora menglaensis]